MHHLTLRALILFLLVMIFTVFVIVVIQQGERRVSVRYKRQMRGRRQVGGQSNYVPLRVNASGMIPIIFAQALLIFPGLIAGYLAVSSNETVAEIGRTVSQYFSPGSSLYWIFYFVMVVGFTYFYTDVIFKQQNIAETLRRQGGVIEGFREGRPTAIYLQKVMMRITFVGAIYLGLIAILSWLVSLVLIPFGITVDTTSEAGFIVGSVGLLIVVGVVLDTMKQLEAQLTMRHYERFIGG